MQLDADFPSCRYPRETGEKSTGSLKEDANQSEVGKLEELEPFPAT